MTQAEEDRFRQTGWPELRGKLFHFYFRLKRPMTLGVRGLVHDTDQNAVFLIRHTYVPGWQLPGGGVEVGETAIEALEREILEETAIRIAGQPQLKSIHFSRHISRRDHVALYLIENFRQTGPKLPDKEIAGAAFFALERLPEDTTPATRRRIAEVFHGTQVSPDW